MKNYWPAYPIYHPAKRFTGVRPMACYSWTEVKQLAASTGMVQCLKPLMHCLWIGDALRDREVTAIVGKRHGLRILRVGSHAIVGPECWEGGPEGANATLDYCGVGGWPTRGRLGLALLREYFPLASEAQPLSPPSGQARRALREGLIGGRVDTLIPGETFPELWEADINMAYTNALRLVPSGQTFRLAAGVEYDGISYRRYQVTLPNVPPPLGPLPVRGTQGVTYPRQSFAGMSWAGWYWSEEIDSARSLGYHCKPYDGWGWVGASSALNLAADHIWQLRKGAPNKQIADNIKLAANEAIGIWACGDTITRLAPAEDGELDYIDPELGRMSAVTMLDEPAEDAGSLIHIASYVYMKTRMKLFWRAFDYADRGQLVATNYDAVYTTEEPTPVRSDMLGGWKVKALHNASVPKPRWLLSEEKVTTPGVSHADL